MEIIPLQNSKQRRFRVKVAAVSIIVMEILIGIYVLLIVYQKTSPVLPVSKSRIHKSNNSVNGDSALRYFYEPIQSTQEVDTTSWMKNSVIFNYNNDTLNDRFDYPVIKTSNTFRIIALGDSFTFGDHVNTKDSWPEKLEDMLNERLQCTFSSFEVLNLGVRGYDIEDEVERFKIRGVKYKPDLVIWMLISNDFDEINELFTPILESERQLASMKNDKSNQNFITIGESAAYISAKSKFLKKYNLQKRQRILSAQIRSFYSLHFGATILVSLPSLDTENKKMITEWALANADTLYFDGLPETFIDEKLRVLDGHFSELGHQKIAEAMYAYLRQQVFSTCN